MSKREKPSAKHKEDKPLEALQDRKFPLNLSVNLEECMIRPVTDSMAVGTKLVEYLIANFELELLKRQVEGQFKQFSIRSTLSTIQQTMLVSTITNDPGDSAEREYSNFIPIDYNYSEEEEEPDPCETDPHIPGSKMQAAASLKNRTDIEDFNQRFMANKGVMPIAVVSSITKQMSSSKRRFSISTITAADSPHMRPKIRS